MNVTKKTRIIPNINTDHISTLITFQQDITGIPILDELNLPNLSSQNVLSQVEVVENIVTTQQKLIVKNMPKEKAKANTIYKSNSGEKGQIYNITWRKS